MARVSIEDCLDFIENRFALVSVASHRTRQLMSGKTPLVRTKNKEAVTALREIADGLVESLQPIRSVVHEEPALKPQEAPVAAAAAVAPPTGSPPATSPG